MSGCAYPLWYETYLGNLDAQISYLNQHLENLKGRLRYADYTFNLLVSLRKNDNGKYLSILECRFLKVLVGAGGLRFPAGPPLLGGVGRGTLNSTALRYRDFEGMICAKMKKKLSFIENRAILPLLRGLGLKN